MLKKVFAILVAVVVLFVGFHTEDTAAAAATKTKYVTASALNVRSGASTKYKIITTVKKNQSVKVLQTKGSWDKITVGKKTGWASNKYLTTKKAAPAKKAKKSPAKKATTKTKYVTASALNVRSGASTKYKVVTTVKKNQSVKVTQTKGTWDKITVGKKTGWASNKYLTTKKPAPAKTAKKSPAKKPAKPKNLASGLKTVGKNKQLILVTASGYNTSAAEIRTFEKDSKGNWKPLLTVPGHIGKDGFIPASKMSESGKKSPTGKYTIGTAFGRNKQPGTKLKYRKIISDDVWVDDPKSKLYNTWQSRKKTHQQWKSAENMNVAAYNYGFVIDYNTKRTPYKGSAIFFHVSNSYTLGCTGTSQANVLKILKWLDPKKNPVIIQTPIKELNKY